MDKNSIQLREQRASLVAESRKILDANPNGLDAESQEKFDRIMGEFDSLTQQVETEERKEHQSKLEAELKESTAKTKRDAPHRPSFINSPEQENRAFNTWFARASGVNVSHNDLAAAESAGVNPYADRFTINLEKRVGLNVGTGSAGGYLVPRLLNNQLEHWLKYYSNLRQVCRVERTPTGAIWDYPTVDATSLSVSVTAEATAATEADPTFGKVAFSAFKYPVVCKMSKEFVTDNIMGDGIMGILAELLGEVISRSQSHDFEIGAGTTVPLGLQTAATNAGSTVKNTGTLSFDDLLALVYGVDRIYQNNISLFMSQNTLLALRKLKDSNGRYLWSEFMLPVTNEIQERIAGKPVVVCNNLHDYASGTGSGSGTPFIIAAVPSKFIIRDVQTVDVEVNPYLYMATNQVSIHATMRSDSNYIGPTNSIAFLSCA